MSVYLIEHHFHVISGDLSHIGVTVTASSPGTVTGATLEHSSNSVIAGIQVTQLVQNPFHVDDDINSTRGGIGLSVSMVGEKANVDAGGAPGGKIHYYLPQWLQSNLLICLASFQIRFFWAEILKKSY